MSPPTENLQRIARFAPLAEILSRLDAVSGPVAPADHETAAAVGFTLARDVQSNGARPQTPIALRDGWAVASERVLDAGPYAPAPLPATPVWVEAGEPLPADTDAILPADAVSVTKSGAEAHASAIPGEGVMPAGGDAPERAVLLRQGKRVRPSDAALIQIADIRNVSVRAPRVKIFSVTVPTRSRADTLSPLIARAVEAEGGIAQVAQAATLESALVDRACDAIVAIGGTGSGKRDRAVHTLARLDRLELHGFGISPGATAALGTVQGRPVLMLPGRIDAALAAFLIVGRALLRRLSARVDADPGTSLPLVKKVTSTVGLAELVLVRRVAEGIEPIASGVWPLQTLAQADGWILVPPESEGFAAGAAAEMRSLP